MDIRLFSSELDRTNGSKQYLDFIIIGILPMYIFLYRVVAWTSLFLRIVLVTSTYNDAEYVRFLSPISLGIMQLAAPFISYWIGFDT
jgi:hypothetical protein